MHLESSLALSWWGLTSLLLLLFWNHWEHMCIQDHFSTSAHLSLDFPWGRVELVLSRLYVGFSFLACLPGSSLLVPDGNVSLYLYSFVIFAPSTTNGIHSNHYVSPTTSKEGGAIALLALPRWCLIPALVPTGVIIYTDTSKWILNQLERMGTLVLPPGC